MCEDYIIMKGKKSKYLILFYDGVLNNKNMFNKDKDYSYVYSRNILYLKEIIEKYEITDLILGDYYDVYDKFFLYELLAQMIMNKIYVDIKFIHNKNHNKSQDVLNSINKYHINDNFVILGSFNDIYIYPFYNKYVKIDKYEGLERKYFYIIEKTLKYNYNL